MEGVRLFSCNRLPEGLNNLVAFIFFQCTDTDGKRCQMWSQFDNLHLAFQAAFFQDQKGNDTHAAAHADHGYYRFITGDLGINMGTNAFFGKPFLASGSA